MHCLRASIGLDVVFEGLLCCVPLMKEDGCWKLTLLAVVFLKLLRPWVWGVMHGLSRSISRSQKVTCLAVFLKLPGAEEGTLMLSLWGWDLAARLGTLSRIPSLSKVA